MCLAIPSKIIAIDPQSNMATVDTMGVTRTTSLDLLPEPPKIGDYVLIHIGYAMNIIDEADALETLETFKTLIEQMDGQET